MSYLVVRLLAAFLALTLCGMHQYRQNYFDKVVHITYIYTDQIFLMINVEQDPNTAVV